MERQSWLFLMMAPVTANNTYCCITAIRDSPPAEFIFLRRSTELDKITKLIYSDVTVAEMIERDWHSTKLLQKQKLCSFRDTVYFLHNVQRCIFPGHSVIQCNATRTSLVCGMVLQFSVYFLLLMNINHLNIRNSGLSKMLKPRVTNCRSKHQNNTPTRAAVNSTQPKAKYY